MNALKKTANNREKHVVNSTEFRALSQQSGVDVVVVAVVEDAVVKVTVIEVVEKLVVL
jgi:3-hydroxyacyl-CoA dehydrogenase